MSRYLRCYLVIPLYHLSLKHTYYLMRSSLWVVNGEEKHRYDLQMNQYGMQILHRRNVCESHWCSGQNILQHICLCITVEGKISWSTSIHEQSPTCWLGIWRNQWQGIYVVCVWGGEGYLYRPLWMSWVWRNPSLMQILIRGHHTKWSS